MIRWQPDYIFDVYAPAGIGGSVSHTAKERVLTGKRRYYIVYSLDDFIQYLSWKNTALLIVTIEEDLKASDE